MNNSIVTQEVSSVKTESAAPLSAWMTVSYLEQFKQHLQDEDRSDATIRAYTIGVQTFEAWLAKETGEALEPARITPLDVKRFKLHLVDAGLKPNSVNNYLAGLRAFCRWAQDTKITEHDPASRIKMVKVTKRTAPKWLDSNKQYALRRKLDQEIQLGDLRAQGDKTAPAYVWPRRDRAIVILMLSTGLRLSEAAALKTSDVEINARSGKVTVRYGKGGKARTIGLNKDARGALAEWLAVRPEQSKHAALFVSQKGLGPLSGRAFSEVVRALGEQVGITDLHPHMLRHTFAKNALNSGEGIEKVSLLLGHSNIATTTIYITPSEADLQRVVDRISWEED